MVALAQSAESLLYFEFMFVALHHHRHHHGHHGHGLTRRARA